jgi:c-di-GMP-binding flagellar brake protein YcgR
VPVNDGEYLMLHSGERVEVNSYSEEDRCYNFHTEVISRGKEGNIIYFKISIPYDIRKIQRRNFFRVGLVNPIEYKIITNVNEGDFDTLPYKEGLMVDLSAGGLKLKIKDNIKKEDILLINVKLKKIQAELKCDIVRIDNTPDKEILCGLRFIDIIPAQSEKIIEELFELVRKQRAKL